MFILSRTFNNKFGKCFTRVIIIVWHLESDKKRQILSWQKVDFFFLSREVFLLLHKSCRSANVVTNFLNCLANIYKYFSVKH